MEQVAMADSLGVKKLSRGHCVLCFGMQLNTYRTTGDTPHQSLKHLSTHQECVLLFLVKGLLPNKL